MKKVIAGILTFALLAVLLAGCSGQEAYFDSDPANEPSQDLPLDTTQTEPVAIRIGGLKGPTSIGMVDLMENNPALGDGEQYAFTLAATADELTPLLAKGELDMAAVPANLASVLYNNTNGAIQVLAVNTLGVLYVLSTDDSVVNITDLKGKTIYATGKGSTPEYNLRYILTQNGIDPDQDVTIEWKSEPNEVVAVLKTEGGVAMLPQPYVTVAQGAVEGLRIVLDLTAEWDALATGSRMITGVMVVNTAFAQANPQAVADFLTAYEASINYVKNNVADAALLVEKYDITKAVVAEKAIPYCNLTFMAGSDMKAPLEGYLQVLFDANPKSVGGAMPDEHFYYGAS